MSIITNECPIIPHNKQIEYARKLKFTGQLTIAAKAGKNVYENEYIKINNLPKGSCLYPTVPGRQYPHGQHGLPCKPTKFQTSSYHGTVFLLSFFFLLGHTTWLVGS